MNMERRSSLRHWLADVGYLYLLAAVLAAIAISLLGGRRDRSVVDLQVAGAAVHDGGRFGPPAP